MIRTWQKIKSIDNYSLKLSRSCFGREAFNFNYVIFKDILRIKKKYIPKKIKSKLIKDLRELIINKKYRRRKICRLT